MCHVGGMVEGWGRASHTCLDASLPILQLCPCNHSEGCYLRLHPGPWAFGLQQFGPGCLGRPFSLGKWPSSAPLSFPRLPHPPPPSSPSACSPIVICQYTVIRDVACLIKIAACPKMELPSRTCLIKVLIDKMKKSHPDG